jgi:DNA-binding CsgD family transcriptional regulator
LKIPLQESPHSVQGALISMISDLTGFKGASEREIEIAALRLVPLIASADPEVPLSASAAWDELVRSKNILDRTRRAVGLARAREVRARKSVPLADEVDGVLELSPTERAVLALYVEGLSIGAISLQLGLTREAVSAHVLRIREKYRLAAIDFADSANRRAQAIHSRVNRKGKSKRST